MLRLYCRRVSINNLPLLQINGPVLITANHPNSFFDALLIATSFKQKVYFLARGDVFKNKKIASILTWLGIIPIYRVSEGSEHLHENENTFNKCRNIFREGGIVLIFIEGLCTNQRELLLFKKGAARLALSCWNSNAEENKLQVLPIGLSYNNYNDFGKIIIFENGNLINRKQFNLQGNTSRDIHEFNTIVKKKLEPLIIQIKETLDYNKIQAAYIKSCTVKEVQENLQNQENDSKRNLNLIYLIPGIIGIILHAPLFFACEWWVKNKTKNTVFYDSVLFSLLMILYPFYLILFGSILLLILKNEINIILILLMPLFARSIILLKK